MNKVLIKENLLQEDKLYNGKMILSYKIKYPYFVSDCNQIFYEYLNQYYYMQAIDYLRNDVANLYKEAFKSLEIARENDYPFHPYQAIVDYNITYNKDCIISIYFDKYEYTGGAHGMTTRYSDTWNIKTQKNILLYELFDGNKDYKEYIINYIIEEIRKEIDRGNNIYFDNYEELVRQNFKTSNFYLSQDGVVIYFMQYDIAPYSSGILTFTIPVIAYN